jgi:hypothetical protein
MLEFILKYNTGDEICKVPQSWNDVTFKQYVELINRDEEGEDVRHQWLIRLSILTGLKEETILELPQTVVESMINCIMFTIDSSAIIDLPVPEEFKHWEYESITMGDGWAIDKILDINFKELKEDLGRDPEEDELRIHRINCASKIVEQLTRKKIGDKMIGRKIDDEPVTEVLGLVNFFLLRLQGSDISTGS